MGLLKKWSSYGEFELPELYNLIKSNWYKIASKGKERTPRNIQKIKPCSARLAMSEANCLWTEMGTELQDYEPADHQNQCVSTNKNTTTVTYWAIKTKTGDNEWGHRCHDQPEIHYSFTNRASLACCVAGVWFSSFLHSSLNAFNSSTWLPEGLLAIL